MTISSLRNPIFQFVAIALTIAEPNFGFVHTAAPVKNTYGPTTTYGAAGTGNRSMRMKSDPSPPAPPSPPPILQHTDVTWNVRPFYDKDGDRSKSDRFKHKLATSAIRFECRITGQTKPTVLLPRGGKTVLEAYVVERGKLGKKRVLAGRFGMTTKRGPADPLIDNAMQKYLASDLNKNGVAAGAIIFMYVSQPYRSRGLGTLAIDVMSALQSYIGNDAILCVADDDGSGKLTAWYESHGFRVAEELQQILGTPGGKHGAAMIGPTYTPDTDETMTVNGEEIAVPFLGGACNIKWW